MAAITRALFPQIFVQSLPSLARLFVTPTIAKLNSRNLSATSRLQPVFPEKPDEFLYESSTDEYDSGVDLNVQYFTKSYPCDALAAAATQRNYELATSLAKEYQEARMNIIHRPEYENLADISLSQGDLDSYLFWLSLLPAVSGGLQSPSNNPVTKLITKDQPFLKQAAQILVLHAQKGWSSQAAADLVAILAQYMSPKEFKRIFRDILQLHEQACGDIEQCRQTHTAWRGRAISALARRNQPDLALDIFMQSSDDIVRVDMSAVTALYRATKRYSPRYTDILENLLTPSIRQQIEENIRLSLQDILSNTALTQEGLRFQVHRKDTVHQIQRHSHQKSVILVQTLKRAFIEGFISGTIDPRAIAFFLHKFSKARKTKLIDLFRKRIYRLGSSDDQSMWGVVEMELLSLQGEAHSAVHFYRNAFEPLAAPSFIRTEPQGGWAQWYSIIPKSVPPSPPRLLRPSITSLRSIWKTAIVLSLGRLPINAQVIDESEADGSVIRSDRGEKNDISHLVQLFIDFLEVYDQYTGIRRTFFSNIHAQVRFFELFLHKFATVAPERCAWVMQSAQQRHVRLDHRIWAIYAKTKVDAGEPGFMLQAFELLQKDIGQPLDFSPAALNDLSTIGMRPGMGNSEADLLVPQKVFNAYVYGFRQLVAKRAYGEAVELHRWIVDAGYKEGSSLPLDRLVFTMLDGMRPRVRRIRHQVEDSNQRDSVEDDIEL